jgi:folate-binding protein YgfZ
VPFLQGLVTANLERLGIGEATHAALLTPQGKVLSAFFARRTADGMLLDCAPGEAGPLAQRLTLYKLRAPVAIEDRSEAMRSCVGDEGPEGARADPRLIAMGSRWLSEAASAEDDGAYDARRVSLGVPEFGYDYGPGEVFPMDVNLDALGTVDYRKGCFVGQEVASRMYRKGEVRKRSWCVAAEGDLAPGAEIVAGGSTLGTVTSARGHSGIALLRVDRVQAATERPSAGGVPVTLSPPAYLEGAGAGR